MSQRLLMPRIGALVVLWVLAVVCWLPINANSQTPPVQRHGHSDVFSQGGISVVWAVLRGADEQTTQVVWRIHLANHADTRDLSRLSLEGVDPFSQARQTLHTAGVGWVVGRVSETEIRVPRSHFSDFPRTEISFFAESDPKSTTPNLNARPAVRPAKIVIYYLGVPDTTPEFNTAEAVKNHLDARVKRLSLNPPP